MKPILFNTEMVRAILDGRKTVTRRVVKPQPPATSVVRKRGCAWDWSFWADCDMGHLMKPPYQPGDTLWVRETWNGDWCDHYIYKADGGSAKAAGYAADPKWRPSIHMPREAARLFLRVTGVRVERLQESFFDQGDAPIKALQNEGIDIGDQCRQCIENYGNPCCNDLDPELEPDENGEDKNGGSECGMLDEVRSDFAKLWDNTVKPEDRATYGWEAHPWVFVIEFERISKDEALGGGRD
ncbi:hypothetical protein [Intestinimonas massiliensis (ex Afouda et al. 2020)]|uniref:ASCH domain-containing protein n=1 Tax=Intestinimonas massiliensis (ex Afouda et al. 2020) TaxID=1673721 RepID=A0ABS9M858_9FIRM|nr:hypothetical protein [Intestinimonas massiliensis (ex Afouda et al. 2020)]MCG4526931.1 hypothetical protein [Intestinimonas massiliensis (ex Afouda et al. 2020)]